MCSPLNAGGALLHPRNQSEVDRDPVSAKYRVFILSVDFSVGGFSDEKRGEWVRWRSLVGI
jgi:hypothetical protein